MAESIKPIRRVVTGNDAQGRSCVLYDSAAPNVNANAFKKGTAMTDVWVFDACPAVITGTRDDGNLPFNFEPPHTGGHLRIVQSDAKPADYDPAADRFLVPPHPPKRTEGGTWERGGQNLYTTRMHKSETLDYGILLAGERVLTRGEPRQRMPHQQARRQRRNPAEEQIGAAHVRQLVAQHHRALLRRDRRADRQQYRRTQHADHLRCGDVG